jgi:hypothetical protein
MSVRCRALFRFPTTTDHFFPPLFGQCDRLGRVAARLRSLHAVAFEQPDVGAGEKKLKEAMHLDTIFRGPPYVRQFLRRRVLDGKRFLNRRRLPNLNGRRLLDGRQFFDGRCEMCQQRVLRNVRPVTHLFGFAWMIDRQGVAELRELMSARGLTECRIRLQASKKRPQPRVWVGGRYDSHRSVC